MGDHLVLPGRRKKKENERGRGGKISKIVRGGEQTINKNKERKMRRILEEKERKARLVESLELLEKHRLRDDVICLLRSSGKIGQVQTMREKCLLNAQFSKVGLDMPIDDRPTKRRRGGSNLAADMGEPDPCFDSNTKTHNIDANNVSLLVQEKGSQEHASCGSEQYDGPSLDHSLCKDLYRGEDNSAIVQIGIKDPEVPMREVQFSNDQMVASLAPCCNNSKSEKKLQSKAGDDINICPIAAPNTSVFDGNFVRRPEVVHISRLKEVEEQRNFLPIIMMEQEIMEAISENSSVIICGETGCGKTTQVPQFLYEAGYGSNGSLAKNGIIGITQPRRVAVLATAKRVAHELGFCLGKEVGFQVRHDKMIGEKCRIKFMTDGILLRELQSDILLKKYSVMILDEAHERSLNTDILVGMLSRITNLRQKMFLEQQEKLLCGVKIKPEDTVGQLKLVLMSATLRVEDFVSNSRLFQEPPPVIEVPTRQFPVGTHFSKKTELVDYVGQAYKKVMQIHKRLPPGGILVFLTGQREIEYLCKKLRRASDKLVKNSGEKGDTRVPIKNDMQNALCVEMNGSFDQQIGIFDTDEQDENDPEKDSDISSSDDEGDVPLDWSDEDSEVSACTLNTDHVLKFIKEPETLASLKASFDALYENKDFGISKENNDIFVPSTEKSCVDNSFSGALHVLPLYARLPASEQFRVFDNVSEGERLVVIATNVAETSLTIPGIKYVVDTGREKVRNYNHMNGMETYEVQWISKASAAQRMGRAGRTAPGHCYRLYSSAVFSNIFSEFSCPQISKIPVEGVILFMKYMGISNVAQFPFPTPPDSAAILEAERCLKALEALDGTGRLTSLGRVMAQFPMSPRHSRMLLSVTEYLGTRQSFTRANLVLGYALAAAAVLSFPNPFNFEGNHGISDDLDQEVKSEFQKDKGNQKKLKALARKAREKFCNPTSDAFSISYALQLFELAEKPSDFCKNNSLHYKTMDEMSKLRKQLLKLIFTYGKSIKEFQWNHGSARDVEDAWRVFSDKHPLSLNDEDILAQAICAGWADRVAKRLRKTFELSENDQKSRSVRYQSCAVNETIFLHRCSMVARAAPEFLVYTELRFTKRPYMHGVTSIKSEWLAKYASFLCSFSSPLSDPRPYYAPRTDELFCWVKPTFGPHLWELPLYKMPIMNIDLRVSIFACALLEGYVLPCLRSAQQFLAALPSIVLRPEAFGQRRVGDLLSRMKRGPKMIDSRTSLQEAWKDDPLVLYTELKSWFQGKYLCKFEEFWQRMHKEVFLDVNELFPEKKRKTKKLRSK